MKFGQLLEYSMRNIFHEKSCTKCGEVASPRPFYKKMSISLDQLTEMLYSCKVLNTCSELIEAVSKKQKKVWK